MPRSDMPCLTKSTIDHNEAVGDQGGNGGRGGKSSDSDGGDGGDAWGDEWSKVMKRVANVRAGSDDVKRRVAARASFRNN